jgi:DNA-directed RNA polymerase subunit RPC12/RpoP
MFICERCGAETDQSEALQAGQEAKSAYPRCPRCGSCRMELKAAPATVSGLAINQEHYNAGGRIQPIEVMQSNMTPERFLGFLQGNVIKYSMRAGRKDDEKKEVDKAIQYAKWWRQALDGETIDPRAK